jgi:hypothetical protein
MKRFSHYHEVDFRATPIRRRRTCVRCSACQCSNQSHKPLSSVIWRALACKTRHQCDHSTLNATRRTFRRSSMLRDACRPAVVLSPTPTIEMNEGKRTVAPPRHRLRMASTTSIMPTRVARPPSTKTVVYHCAETPSNDVEVLACARDDVVGETESARATPPRVAHRCNAAPSYSPFISVSVQIYSPILCRIRTLCDDNECCTERQVNFDT